MCKVSFELDGTIYRDYELKSMHNVGFSDMAGKSIINEELLNHLEKLDINIDESFSPSSGSKIYVAPNCPVATADIRNNYTLKRNYDDPEIVCNVFSPSNKYYARFSVYSVAVFNSNKVIIIDDNWQPGPSMQEICKFLECDILKADKYIPRTTNSQFSFPKTCMTFYYTDFPESYIKYVFGELKKPCIRISQLKLNQNNPLTFDVIKLVYEVGKNTDRSENALQNFNTQIMALNQYCWRDYPKTIQTLLDILIRPGCIASKAAYCRSQAPKPIREILGFSYDGPAKSKEDFEFAQQILMYATNIGRQEFVSTKDFLQAVIATGIDLDRFNELFYNITRIKPKQYA